MRGKLNLKTTLIATVALAGVPVGHYGENLVQHVRNTSLISSAQAAGGIIETPNQIAPERYVC